MKQSIQTNRFMCCIFCLIFCLTAMPLISQSIIVDHSCTDITQIPEYWINEARSKLHIGYGHTSHGNQLATGMTGLVDFANGGGLGLSLPEDIFEWNNGGVGGALDLEEGAGYDSGWLELDCGYYPDWIDETREYLNSVFHQYVNVIIWSWCGEVSDRTEQQIINEYLNPMAQLEQDYPSVQFVYMTGHADGSGEEGNLHLRNRQIRTYCQNNNKVLYDFYDIECYDPDGNYYGDRYVDDGCYYDGGNWAIEWQNSHIESEDWYNCESAHSQPLNANRKAYAVWWLWAKLAGWDGTTGVQESFHQSSLPNAFVMFHNYPNPFNSSTQIEFSVPVETKVVIKVYNLAGKEVKSLTNEIFPAGSHTVHWDGTNSSGHEASSGVYFYQLVTKQHVLTRKMISIR